MWNWEDVEIVGEELVVCECGSRVEDWGICEGVIKELFVEIEGIYEGLELSC